MSAAPLPLLTFAPSSAADPLVLKDAQYDDYARTFSDLKQSSDAVSTHIQISYDLLPPKKIAERLIALHFGHDLEAPLSMPDICDFYCFLSNRFETFAHSLESFCSLSQNDRSVLLSSNTPLYFQYHLANYVNSDNGLKQISGLLNVEPSYLFEKELLPLTSCDAEDFILTVSLNYFVSMCAIFNDKAQVNTYEALAEKLGELHSFPDTVHYIAGALLFFCRPNFRTSLDDPALVQREYEKALHILHKGMSSLYLPKNSNPLFKTTKVERKDTKEEHDLEPLNHTITHYSDCIHTLDRLTHFYSQHGNICNFPEEGSRGSVSKMHELSEEADFWQISEEIQRDFDIPFGRIALGSSSSSLSQIWTRINLNKSYLLRVFYNRLYSILRENSSFNELSSVVQGRIRKKNCMVALGILCLYLEAENDALQQLKILLGSEETYFFHGKSSHQSKKLTFFPDSANAIRKMIPHHQDVTKLVILCVLFQDEASLAEKYSYYQTLLQRRFQTLRMSPRNASKENVYQLIQSSETQKHIFKHIIVSWSSSNH